MQAAQFIMKYMLIQYMLYAYYLCFIGGTCGLWIGWSIITGMEFLEMLLDLLAFACSRFKNQKVNSQ